jgi:hypothetical protein
MADLRAAQRTGASRCALTTRQAVRMLLTCAFWQRGAGCRATLGRNGRRLRFDAGELHRQDGRQDRSDRTARRTVVAIAGEELHGVTDVMFGSRSATSFTTNPDGESIMAVAPAQTAEQVAISVVTAFGTSEPEYCARNKVHRRKCAVRDHYKFQEPEITSLAPSAGPRVGGTKVTIAGSGFGVSPGETEFLLGIAPATSVECSSSASCTAIAPASSKAGTALLKVTVHSNEPKSSKKSKAIGFIYE